MPAFFIAERKLFMKLIIAEKPSVAKGIAAVVGAKTLKDGHFEGGGYLVSWCYGHLVKLKTPTDYGNGWEQAWSFEQLPIIPQKWGFKVVESGKKQFYILKELMKRADVSEIICATDADREGECIFRYVYYFAGCKTPVSRLWLSNLEQSAIRKALNSVKPMSEYDNLFAAGYVRAKSDWLVGMNGSRLFSLRYGSRLTLGRVQTPTLAMIVQRDYEVDNFVKQRFFTVDLDCGGFTLTSPRIDDEQTAERLAAACDGNNAVITYVKHEMKSEKPPKLYDLTSLQRDANRIYGYTAKETLDYTQKLYESKLVTYPRTDSQYIPDNMAQETLDVIRVCTNAFDEFKITHSPDISRCINNAKVTGHHAIIPTATVPNADRSALSEGENNILMLVITRLICATAPDHKYEFTKIIALCCDTEFTATGRTEISEGWRKYAKTSEKEKNEKDEIKPLPNITEGRNYDVVAANKTEHFTTPPKPYTEDTLLSAMERAGNEDYEDDEAEKKGLGTPATRAAIIEQIVKNGYVERQKKQLRSTDKGKELVKVVPDEVKSPKLTAQWETKLQQIERRQYSANTFLDEITAYVTEMCGKYSSVDNSSALTAVINKSNEPLGKCPKCSADVVKGKFGYYCKDKCGMNVAKVYGKELTETQLKSLLDGKSISYTAKGKKTVVLPQIEKNEYNGKINYQWKTQNPYNK